MSQYYKQSQDRFEREMQKFESKLNEGWYSDLKFSSDGCSQNHRGYYSERAEELEVPKIKVAQAFFLPFMVSMMCGYFVVNNQKKPKKNECEAPEDSKRNNLTSRAQIVVNPSNAPCEDRFNCYQLKNLEGYYSAVFDGHGGW